MKLKINSGMELQRNHVQTQTTTENSCRIIYIQLTENIKYI